jgi:uncharacterized protein (TIGR00369 family)
MSVANGFPINIPFVEELGIYLVSSGAGRSIIRLDTQPQHLNSWGVAHGGVVMTLLDVAMATAGRTLRTDLGTGGNVTIEMKSSFLRPARGRLEVRGVCLHATSTMAFCEAELYGEDLELAAKSSGTFKFFRQVATGSETGSPKG